MQSIANPAVPILAVALLAWLPACGDAPQQVAPPSAGGPSAAAHSADDGHDHAAHAQAAPSGTPAYSGVIVLKGPRAESDEGVLMVSLVSSGQRMPRMTYRISLSSAAPAVNGERRVPFALNAQSDMLGEGVPGELSGTPLEISVRFDQDGVVETREGDVTVAVPVGWGAENLEVLVGG